MEQTPWSIFIGRNWLIVGAVAWAGRLAWRMVELGVCR